MPRAGAYRSLISRLREITRHAVPEPRTPCCPTIRSRTGIDCWHGFSAATAVVYAHDRAGWVHRHQLIVIEFLQAENQLLKERLRGKRIRFTDAERALLGRKAKAVVRKALMKLDTIACPDTLLRWHRQFVAQKWNFTHRRGPGRPGIMREISELIVRMAQDESTAAICV
jgi:hypothetical protein